MNAVQPLPFVEFRTPWSQGYNRTDIFSPEMDYCVGNKVPPTARNSATAWDSSRTVRMFEEQA